MKRIIDFNFMTKALVGKIATCVLSSFLLTSCFFSAGMFVKIPPKNTAVNDYYPNNKKGLVIIRTLSPVQISWKYYSIDNDRYKRSDIESNIYTFGPGDYQVLMLEPGVYSLRHLYNTHYGYWIDDTGYLGRVFEPLSSYGTPHVIAFEVKPEVVNYVGDIELKNPYSPVIKNNLEAAKSFFKKKYPKINSPIIENLAYGRSGKNIK
jgi:hypothetical protein